MPPKYHIEIAPAPSRLLPISRSGVMAWEEGCLKCARCAKKQCVYRVYHNKKLQADQMRDSLDFTCRDCFRCVQNCPKGLIQKTLNPDFRALGDDYWTGEIISKLWYQAETGKIPVSGAGYGGPFSGPGFDSMWTDMSEIVRPTRDGIHGREYISTAVDLGRKPMNLQFGPDGRIEGPMPPLLEIPLPVILDKLPWAPPSRGITMAILRAAGHLGTLAVVTESHWDQQVECFQENAVLHLEETTQMLRPWLREGIHLVELEDGPELISRKARLKEINPDLVVMTRLELGNNSVRRALELARQGVEVLHLKADPWGRDKTEASRFVLESTKEVHFHLVEAGVRDAVSLVVGGGVAMAEHMCKLLIAGADAVSVDVALLIAMDCRVCRRCAQGLGCPVGLEEVDPSWGGARIRNLMAAWHGQLLEVMGAMGLRDARRLRGEMGRAMFFEDLEREFFSGLGRRA
ncbi:MAG: glutamate synthase-related protein [Thermodesulfobacteriota bacterium]